MRFGHYTVFDTPAENKHTQVYVEYDVPNNDDLDGATGTMILSDGSGDSSGGGDSRFSTCEVEVFFTSNGQPLTLDSADVMVFTGYSAGPIPADDESLDTYYVCSAKVDPDRTVITPLMYEGVAYSAGANGSVGSTYYVMSSDAPVCTGDISVGTFGDMPVIIIRGNGTITFKMVED